MDDSSNRAVETRSVVGTQDGSPTSRYLLVIEGSSSRLIDLPDSGAWIIGRVADSGLAIDDASVSRRHARLFFSDGEVRIADLDSYNGTRVNGIPVVGTSLLTPGDVISVGEVTLVLGASARASPEGEGDPLDDPSARISLGERTMIVADPAMRRIHELIQKIAASDLPVLVCGETGTGKENAAFAVHHHSARRVRPFVSLNCAAFPDTLFESEVFGHQKGAFTGANTNKLGLLETACGGTVFLDEIAELSPAAQAKLLRVLDTKHVLRIGDVLERAIDVRIVAATNRKLGDEVAAGRFRQDLFYRLAGATIMLPPLRDRPREIGVLARTFLAAACDRAGKPTPTLSSPVLRRLLSYGWPGNIRELKNTMEYVAATVSNEAVTVTDLPSPLGAASAMGIRFEADPEPHRLPEPIPALEPPRPFRPIAEEMSALERRRIEEALAATGGVQTKAAELIGMPLRTFVLRLKQHGISNRHGS